MDTCASGDTVYQPSDSLESSTSGEHVSHPSDSGSMGEQQANTTRGPNTGNDDTKYLEEALKAVADTFPVRCDVFIACPENDLELCEKLKCVLEKLYVEDQNGLRNVIVGPISADLGQSRLNFYEQHNNLTLFMLMFISENYEERMQLVKEQAIEREMREKKNHIIPIYRCCASEKEFTVYGLDGRKGISATDLFVGTSLAEANVEEITYENLNKPVISKLEKLISKELSSDAYRIKAQQRRAEMEKWSRDYQIKCNESEEQFKEKLREIERKNDESTAALARSTAALAREMEQLSLSSRESDDSVSCEHV